MVHAVDFLGGSDLGRQNQKLEPRRAQSYTEERHRGAHIILAFS